MPVPIIVFKTFNLEKRAIRGSFEILNSVSLRVCTHDGIGGRDAATGQRQAAFRASRIARKVMLAGGRAICPEGVATPVNCEEPPPQPVLRRRARAAARCASASWKARCHWSSAVFEKSSRSS
jgi:hypothetical protein